MNKMTFSAAFLLLLLAAPRSLTAAPPYGTAKGEKNAGAGAAAAAKGSAQQVRFELTLSRVESKDNASATTAPALLGSPTLTTLDRNTASFSVTAADTSYNVSLSPTVETANNSVQVLWNVRLTGKNLGSGATAIAASGATRLTAGKEGGLAEISVTDTQTGKQTTFLLRAKATVGDAPVATAPAKPS